MHAEKRGHKSEVEQRGVYGKAWNVMKLKYQRSNKITKQKGEKYIN